MARKKSMTTEDQTTTETEDLTPEVSESVSEEAEQTSEEGKEVNPSAKEPAEVKLHTPSESNEVAPAVSKEKIEAAIQEKLSRKTDSEGADPFVPNIQLEKEVKEIANKSGFPLSRGTEIGARLMARSKRMK